MARIDTPVQSDDEFDLVYDAESVSEISDPAEAPQHSAMASAGSERLTGPHEIPVMPVSPAQDDLTHLSQDFSEHSIRDEPAVPSSSLRRGSGSTKSRGNFVNDGLQYTKSVYNKLWSKDALIAVMGYVYQSSYSLSNCS